MVYRTYTPIPVKEGPVHVIILLLIIAISMTLIEYIAGIIFIKTMHVRLWDYTMRRGNIQGIICPLFSFFYGVFAVDVFYSFSLINRIRKFAKEKEIIVRYEAIKASIRNAQEKNSEKIRFLFALRSDVPLREHLEKYIELMTAFHADHMIEAIKSRRS